MTKIYKLVINDDLKLSNRFYGDESNSVVAAREHPFFVNKHDAIAAAKKYIASTKNPLPVKIYILIDGVPDGIIFELKYVRPNPRHSLYTTEADAPDSIRDRNGAVVLQLCKICNRGEIELKNTACVSLPLSDSELPGMWEKADFMGGEL